ncbi:MAG: hypothetical protein HRT69_15770 [Flavobacteriaceae bacterium]|nr:hypothetical protein [Flavobacteriaceae bacterium]
MGELNLSRSGESTSQSRVDSLSGTHTTSLLVTVLFAITLIGLIILVCVKTKAEMPDDIVTGLIGLLSALIGFFAGNSKRDKD